MPYGLYISAEGAQAQSKRLEVISNNLANVDTASFKRDLTTLQARHAEATERGLDSPGSGSINDLGGGVSIFGTQTEFGTGPLKKTGVETDLAIQGDGFFVVSKDGQNYLTRAGNFMLNPQGMLTTDQGHAVLNESGQPINIDPTLGPWSVNDAGGIVQAGAVNNLALVEPQSLGDLVKVGNNTFSPLADTVPVQPGRRQVSAGYLEQSGVQATTEMMEMIEASRAFEANVNLIRNQDQMLGTLIGRVLRGSS